MIFALVHMDAVTARAYTGYKQYVSMHTAPLSLSAQVAMCLDYRDAAELIYARLATPPTAALARLLLADVHAALATHKEALLARSESSLPGILDDLVLVVENGLVMLGILAVLCPNRKSWRSGCAQVCAVTLESFINNRLLERRQICLN